MNKTISILLIILLLATALRFSGLGEESLWVDEGATALTMKKYSNIEIIDNIVSKGQILPGYYNSNLDLPMYYVGLKHWTNVFGISEFALRSFFFFC